MVEKNPFLSRCFQEASSQSADLVGRCVDIAATSLQEAEAKESVAAVRTRMGRAWWSLLRNRYTFKQGYPVRLLQAFGQHQPQAEFAVLGDPSDSAFAALGEDLTFSEPTEATRLLKNLLPEVEQALAVLDARMSALASEDGEPLEKNPLRPSVFVHVLREMLFEAEPDAKTRTLWLQHLGAPMGQHLSLLYERVALMLQSETGQDASYRMRLVADPQASRADTNRPRDLLDWGPNAFGEASGATGGSVRPGDLPAMPALGRTHARLEQELFHAFLSDDQARFEQPLDDSFYQQVEQEWQRLEASARLPTLNDVVAERQRTQLRGLAVVDRPARLVNVGSQLNADRWGASASSYHRSSVLLDLKRRARWVSQAVGLDLVRKLVNQVARDPLLLAPVREAVVALEPALLRLALVQPRYLDENQHPARLLIEQVAERSFRYNDEFSASFEQFMQPLQVVCSALNARETAASSDFAVALQALRKEWDGIDAAEQALREQQVRAMRFAESRQALANEIALMIGRRTDLIGVPDWVLDFLYNDWALVVASARLNHPEAGDDPFGYMAVVDRLLWSAREEVTLRKPKQLFEIVPEMLRSLQRGLAMLGKSREDSQAFFDALMALHKPVLSLRRASARKDGVPSGAAPLEEEREPFAAASADPYEPVSSIQPQLGEGMWLDERELLDVGFEEAPASEPAELYESPVSMDAFEAYEDLPVVPANEATDGSLADGPDPAPEPPGAESLARSEAAALLDGIREGDWVDLHSRGEWLRAQLTWTSDTGGMFMFISQGGGTHSMTRRSCEKLIRNRLLRPVQVRAVVQTALVAVA